MTDGPGFIHLNCHSAYSLLEGALPLATLVDEAVKDGMPAVGVTDTANLFGALEFSEKAAGKGLQPIVGCKLPIRFEPEQDFEARRPGHRPSRHVAHLFLLAANEAGYHALIELVTEFYLGEAGRAEPILLETLAARADGLIALTGGHDGALYPLIAEGEEALAEARVTALKQAFGDRLYIAVERHGMEIERRAEAGVVGLAYRLDVPLVATNEPFFPAADDYEAHDALLAIAEGRLLSSDDRRRLTPEHHFASRAEMMRRFSDLPEALENTVEIALRCRTRPHVMDPILPRFVKTDADDASAEEAEALELRHQAEEGLAHRLATLGLAPGFEENDYRERLEHELGVITRMKYPGYFLIVADFIKWAKAHSIPVGPGRGSGAGSVVAWALTITDLDPLRFGLLFERFLNPERVSMPDFDVDFCQERRDEVIAYVQERYGRDRVAQIITFGTLQARAALRDVGRVLEMPYGQVDRLCKLVPADPANPVSLEKAVADEPRFEEARKQEPVVEHLLTIAMKLEGLYRHASTHAAGIVIGNRPLHELVPLYRDPRSALPVTQFNMKWVEQAGLVKFDFLGLKTLTVLEHAVKLVKAARGVEIDIGAIPLEDEKTFAMLARGETVGVFQVEGQGMRRALVGMQPDRFEDLIALVALYRPGPMANIPVYCARKLGREEPDYIHPRLEPILEATYGVITYQEQVMQIARDLAGYSLGEADLLRRAMGKKIRSEMEKQRERFMSGATERGIQHADAVAIFDACAKFADYGFNKSHSAPYALITYQTAYMKANYPVEFLAASMTLDMSNTDKLNEFRLEAERLGIEVVPPDVNRSGVHFDVEDGRIVYALAALKGDRRACGGAPSRGARQEALRRPRRLRLAHRSADPRAQAAGMPGAGRRLRRHRSQPRPRLRECRPRAFRRAGAGAADGERHHRSLRRCRRAHSDLPRRRRPVAAIGDAAARVRRDRHVCQRASDRRLRGTGRLARRADLEGVLRAVARQPPVHRAGGGDGGAAAGAAHPHRRPPRHPDLLRSDRAVRGDRLPGKACRMARAAGARPLGHCRALGRVRSGYRGPARAHPERRSAGGAGGEEAHGAPRTFQGAAADRAPHQAAPGRRWTGLFHPGAGGERA